MQQVTKEEPWASPLASALLSMTELGRLVELSVKVGKSASHLKARKFQIQTLMTRPAREAENAARLLKRVLHGPVRLYLNFSYHHHTYRHLQLVTMNANSEKQICVALPTREGLKQSFFALYHYTIILHPYWTSAALLLWALFPKYPFTILYYILYAGPKAILHGITSCLRSLKQSWINWTRDDSLSPSQSYGSIEERERSNARRNRIRRNISPWVALRISCVIASTVIFFTVRINDSRN
ncbi:hypothetical protein BDQ12DRAFT_681988 [Crucibulum laeve]|uniref:Uncharacterized protein n=1 Tax=Crucibulum laeve TaxID=68775 RepID=A0A5C3M2P9_9AGAR|nr:hypothetical protein BDQ12DRAFT_681988 [Crucibulum laeve]